LDFIFGAIQFHLYSVALIHEDDTYRIRTMIFVYKPT